MKTELKLRRLPIHPYVSVRLDRRRSRKHRAHRRQLQPAISCRKARLSSRSERLPLPGTAITSWFEAGEAVKYLPGRTDVGAMIPDYRGGLSYGKGFGHLMGGSRGFYVETNDDGVFVSRFQERSCCCTRRIAPAIRWRLWRRFGGLQAQLYWNVNGTADSLHQYWANYVGNRPWPAIPLPRLAEVAAIFGELSARRLHGESGQSAASQFFRFASWTLVCIHTLICVWFLS